MASNIQFKRATAATLYAVNPVLLRGEPGLEIDTNKIKYGDGVTPWRDLPYGNPAIEVVDGGEFIAPAVTPSPGTFSPPTLAGLVAWLDGTNTDYVHLVNNRLSVWEDMSDNRRRFVQSNRANRPSAANQIEEQTVITFDGANDAMLSNFELPEQFTLLVTFKRRGNSVAGHLISAQSATNTNTVVLCGTETGNEFGVKLGATYYATQPVDDLVTAVYTLQSTGTGFSTRLNGLNTQSEAQAITGARPHFAVGGSRVDFAENNFSGDIAEIIIYDRVLDAPELLDAENYLMSRWGISQVVHPLLEGMKAFWPLNEESGTRTDITDAAVQLTQTGVVDFEAGVIGNSAKFTGGSNYLTAPETFTLDGTFSMSLWFKTPTITGTGGDPPRIIQNWAGGTQGQMTLGFGDEAGDMATVWAYVRTINDNYRVATSALEANRWYHVVVVFDATNNKLQLYVDGALAAQTITSGELATSSIPLRVGIGEQTAMQNTIAFWLDQLGIWDRALAAQDVQMLYNYELGKEDFTADLYGDNVSLLLHMDKPANASATGGGGSSTLWNGLEAFWKLDNLEDMTGNGYTLTNINNAEFVPAKIGNGVQSVSYAQNLLVLENFRIMRAAGFSIGGWIKHSSGGAGGLISQGVQFGFSFGPALYLGVEGAWLGNNIAFGGVEGVDKVDLFSVPGYSADGQWYHLMLTYDGTTAKAYKDGVLVGSGTVAVDDNWDISSRMRILGPMEEYWGDAQADAVGYWTRALTEAEIAELYNDGDGVEDFDASSADPDFANVSLLLHADTDLNDSSTAALTVTPVGDVSVSATQSKFGGASASFGGNGARLDIAASSAFDLSGGDYTVECFFYANDLSGGDAARLWAFETVYESWGLLLANDGNGWIAMNNFGVPVLISAPNGSITTNTWYHVALVRHNGVTTLYLNGNSVGSDNYYTWVPSGQSQLSIGGNSLNFSYTNFNGYVDEFRVTKGVARYTANFTPPTAAFPDQGGAGGGETSTNIVEPPFENVALLLHMDGADFVDRSNNNLVVTANGGAIVSSAQSKFGAASGYFDGVDSSLETSVTLGATGDFTCECWFRAETIKECGIFNQGDSDSFGNFIVGILSNAALVFYASNFERITSPADAVVAGEWYHVALCRSGATITLFLNGAVIGTTNDSLEFTGAPFKVADGYGGIRFFEGYIDDLRVTVGTAVYTGNFIPVGGPHPDPVSNPALLLNFDAGIVDSSLNAHTVNNNFNVIAELPLTAISASFENAGVFDGLGAYLSIPDDPVFDLSSGPFCIELWFYANDLGADLDTGTQVLLSKDQYGVSYSWGIHVSATQIRMPTANIAGDWDFLVNQNISENTWHHIAVTGDGSSMKMFFNGSLIGTKNRTFTNAASEITIGCSSYNNPNAFFNGYIDEVRIVKGAQVYTDNFTPAIFAFDTPRAIPPAVDQYSNNVSLLLNMNGSDGSTTFTDSSTNQLAVTNNGATIITAQSKFGGASGYFDGSGYLTLPASGGDLGSGDFTVECWIHPTLMASSYTTLMGNFPGWSSATPHWQILSNGDVGTLEFWTAEAAFTNVIITPVLDQWQHVAFARSGDILRVFLNGSLVGSAPFYANLSQPTSALWVGQAPENLSGRNWVGYIDDLRITKGVARYTTNFYPPVSQFAITQSGGGGGSGVTATLLLHMDGDSGSDVFTDASTNALVPTVSGTTVSTAESKFGGASAYFEGNSVNTLVYADSPLFGFGTGDFTIEMFTYRVAGGARASVISVGTYQTGILWRLNETNTDNLYLNASATNTAWNWQDGGANGPGGIVPQNAWAHIALVRQGTTVRVFVDGEIAFEEDVGSVDLGASQPLTIGTGAHEATSTDAYYGYIDELRIVKGTAVYTEAFTPPTAPFNATEGGGGGGTGPIAVFIDTSKHNHEITPVGNAYLNLEDIKYGNASGEFAGGHCTIPMSPEFAFGTGDFTVEFWGKLNYAAQSAVFSTSSSAEDAGTYLIGFRDDINMFGFCYDMPNFTFAAADVSAHYDTWVHYAFVRQEGVLKMYVNGVQVATANAAIDLDGGAQTIAVIGRRWTDVDDHYLDGLIDDFRITKGVARYIADFNPPTKAYPDPVLAAPAPPTAGDPYAEYVTLLLSMDGANGSTTFSDSSYLQHVVTPTNATISTAQSKFGGASGYFNGAAELTLPADSGFDFGAGDFTVEGWIYFNSLTTDAFLFSPVDANGWFFGYWTDVAGGLGFGRKNVAWDLVDTTSPQLNTWIHVAASRAGGVLRLFVDGQQVQELTNNTTSYMAGGGLIVGSHGGYLNVDGYIDDVRITKGVARYTENFTPPTIAHLKPFTASASAALLLHFDGADGSTTFADSSVNSLSLTGYGVTISTAQSKFGGASGYFSAFSSLSIQQTEALQLGTADFTVEAWVYLNNTQQNGIFGQPNGGLAFGVNPYGNLFADQANVGGSPLFASSPVALNSWHHVAVSRAAGYGKLFLNGVIVAEGSWGADLTTSAPTFVGDLDYGSWVFNGYIDELRVVKGAAVYTADFTPPTEPFSATSNLTPANITGCDLWLDSTTEITQVGGAIATWPDKSGNNRAATPADYAPAPTIAAGAGPDGQDVVRFTGDPNVLDVSYAFNLKNSSGFVLLKQPNPYTAPAGYQRLLSFQPETGFDYNQDDGMTLALNNYSGTGVELHCNGPRATYALSFPFDWTLIAYSVDADGNIDLRVNGETVANGNYGAMAATAGGNLYIGHGGGFLNEEALQGDIAEIAVFDHKLGPAALVGLEQSILARWLPAGPTTGETLLLAHFDSAVSGSSGETFADSSGKNVGLTSNNGASITTSESKFGGASVILGTMGSGYVTVDSAADLDLSGGDFTIEFWTLPASQNAPYPSILGTNLWFSAHSFSIRHSHNFVANSFSVHSFPAVSLVGDDKYLDSGTTFPPGEWYHVAVTRQGLVDRLFVNGMLVDSYTHTSPPNWPDLTADGTAYIGNSWDGSNGQYAGFVDDLRIVRGQALYTANFPVPNLPAGADLKLLLHMDGTEGSATFTDSSLNGVAVTANSATITTLESKFGGACGYFNGSATLTGPDLELGTERFTLEMWFKPENGGGPQYATLFANYEIADSSSGFGLYYNNNGYGSGGIGLYAWYTICTSIDAYNDGLWHHVAVTRDGDTCNLFVDGQLVGTGGTIPNRSFSSTTGFMLAGSPEISGRNFQGWIDDFRVVKGAVMYTSNFTPPTAPFPDPPTIAASVLMHFDGPTLVDSSATNLSFSSSILGTFDSVNKKFGDAAYSYNNASDIYSTTRGVPDLTDGDFTIECWVYRQTSNSTYANILFLHASDNNLSYNGGLNFYIDQYGTVNCNNGFAAGLSGGNVPVAQWTHLAVVRTGETLTLYVDGAAVATNTQLPGAGPYILCLGFIPSNPGFESDLIVDELRIVKAAVYTEAFNPPTAPFTS